MELGRGLCKRKPGRPVDFGKALQAARSAAATRARTCCSQVLAGSKSASTANACTCLPPAWRTDCSAWKGPSTSTSVPVSSRNSRRAAASGDSFASNSPLGIVHAPSSRRDPERAARVDEHHFDARVANAITAGDPRSGASCRDGYIGAIAPAQPASRDSRTEPSPALSMSSFMSGVAANQALSSAGASRHCRRDVQPVVRPGGAALPFRHPSPRNACRARNEFQLGGIAQACCHCVLFGFALPGHAQMPESAVIGTLPSVRDCDLRYRIHPAATPGRRPGRADRARLPAPRRVHGGMGRRDRTRWA